MTNLEPVNSRNMTSPRAKIGDVVIVNTDATEQLEQRIVKAALTDLDGTWVYRARVWTLQAFEGDDFYEESVVHDKDILKNLTTGATYAN